MEEDEGFLLENLFDESECSTENTSHLSVNKYKATDETTVKQIYHLGRIIARVFREHELSYWVTGGTSLGCVRHCGLIPWDDDLDICMLDEQEEKFLALKDVLLQNGVVMMEAFSGYCLYHDTESEPSFNPVDNPLLNYRLPFCDVFLMRKNEDEKRIELKHGRSRTLWTNEWYSMSSIEPLKQMLYGDFYLLAVNDPLPYLNRTYGEDCLDVGKTHNYDHNTRTNMKSEIVENLNGFQPAKPFS